MKASMARGRLWLQLEDADADSLASAAEDVPDGVKAVLANLLIRACEEGLPPHRHILLYNILESIGLVDMALELPLPDTEEGV